MPNFRILEASILHSSDELNAPAGIPPARVRPLELQLELETWLSNKADVLGACDDLINAPPFPAQNIDEVAKTAHKRFENFVNSGLPAGDALVYVNGGSAPIYFRLPDGSHITEDWLYLEGRSTPRQPWVYDYSGPTQRFLLYPVLHLRLSSPM